MSERPQGASASGPNEPANAEEQKEAELEQLAASIESTGTVSAEPEDD